MSNAQWLSRERAVCSKKHKARRCAVKGEPAEGAKAILEGRFPWAAAEDAADCHSSGALSWNMEKMSKQALCHGFASGKHCSGYGACFYLIGKTLLR